MCQNKLLGVVGGVLGRNTSLIFQKLFTGKSVFLINQFTFWNFSHVNTIKCIFAQFFSLPPEKPRGALTKIRDLSKDLTKGLRKDLSASSSTIVKPRNSNNLFGDRKPMSSLNGGSHPSINSSTRWAFCSGLG